MKVRMNSASSSAMPIASAYSRKVDLAFAAGCPATAPGSLVLLAFSEAMISFVLHFECGEKGLLGNFHFADLFHAFFSFLLPLQKFSLARDVAAVALGGDVFAQRLHRFPRNDPAPD